MFVYLEEAALQALSGMPIVCDFDGGDSSDESTPTGCALQQPLSAASCRVGIKRPDTLSVA
jgi:hypothetical protein